MKPTIADDRVDRALVDPASVFDNPMDVVVDDTLSTNRKIEILRRWEYDEKSIQVAVEEGFSAGEQESLLDTVLAALHQLGAGPDLDHSPPTKQGGV